MNTVRDLIGGCLMALGSVVMTQDGLRTLLRKIGTPS